jgi:hypothetical protein
MSESALKKLKIEARERERERNRERKAETARKEHVERKN